MSLSNKAFIESLVFAIASIILVVLFGGEPPAGSAPMAEGFKTPILALEFARSLDDLAFLQGPDAAGLRANLMRVQSLDQYFPIAYAGMAALFFFGLVLRGNKLAWVGVALATTTILADWSENWVINDMLYGFETGDLAEGVKVNDLIFTTWIKWGLIAAYAAMMALLMFRDKRRILALPSAAASLAIVATYLSGSSGQVAEIMSMTLPFFMFSFPVAAVMYSRTQKA